MPAADATRHRRRSAHHQRLHLDQDRPRALEHCSNRRTRHARAPVGEEPGRRVGHVGQTVLGHLEQPDLVGAAEAVLQRVQCAQRVAPVAVEREHGVDDVLEHARARERALLGDVPDQHRGATVLLGVLHEPVRAVAHLGDRPRRAGEIGIDDGLDGVDRQHLGPGVGGVSEDVRQGGLGHHEQPGLQGADPLGPQLHLRARLLGGDQEAARAPGREAPQGLEQQGALAHARLTREQRDRPGDEPAVQHPVELPHPGGHGRGGAGVDVADRHRAFDRDPRRRCRWTPVLPPRRACPRRRTRGNAPASEVSRTRTRNSGGRS